MDPLQCQFVKMERIKHFCECITHCLESLKRACNSACAVMIHNRGKRGRSAHVLQIFICSLTTAPYVHAIHIDGMRSAWIVSWTLSNPIRSCEKCIAEMLGPRNSDGAGFLDARNMVARYLWQRQLLLPIDRARYHLAPIDVACIASCEPLKNCPGTDRNKDISGSIFDFNFSVSSFRSLFLRLIGGYALISSAPLLQMKRNCWRQQ